MGASDWRVCDYRQRRQRRLVREAGRFNRVNLLKQQDARCAVRKAAFDADLDPHANTNVVVRDYWEDC